MGCFFTNQKESLAVLGEALQIKKTSEISLGGAKSKPEAHLFPRLKRHYLRKAHLNCQTHLLCFFPWYNQTL